MTAPREGFREAYATGLRGFLELRTDASIEVGHELGRRALEDGVSLLAIVENHFVTIAGLTREERYAGLQFLLQTLTVLDVATRSFLDGKQRYEQQRSRADDLAERDAFRRALVDSMQDGFFVADRAGTIIERNGALAEMTGYDDVPIAWPYPWLTRERAMRDGPYYLSDCNGRSEIRIRHRDGRTVWLAVSANSVRSSDGAEVVYVGTARDITAEHDAAAFERAAAALATALVAATTVADVLTKGLEECRAAAGADGAVAAIWRERGSVPLVYATGAGVVDWDEIAPGVRAQLESVRAEPPLTVRAAAGGLSAALGDGRDAALWLMFGSRLPVDGDRALLRLLLGHLGLALQRARNFDQTRTISLTLQRSMLSSLLLPPGFAVRYQPAVAPLEVGGDWYDVVGLDSGRFGIVVGDCVGSGLAAAVVMGQLRSACRALLLSGADPGRLLDELDAVAAHTPGAACTTLCAAILDPATGELTYSSAGHPPALVATLQRVSRLDDGRSLPLATFPCSPRPQATIVLPPGSTLVLFTDGLVERRRVSIDSGLDLAAAVLAATAGESADDVADRILAGLAPDAGFDDDVAMVVYRRTPETLRIDVDARAEELAGIRAALGEWCAVASLPRDRALDLVCAVNELVSNSIEHAYADVRPARVQVVAAIAGDELVVSVADSGTWIERGPDQDGDRGRGLPLARALADSVDIVSADTGTIVTLRLSPLATNRRPDAAPTAAS